MTLAQDIAARWQEAARTPLPETIARVASLHLLDAIGVGLAAAGSSNGRPYLDYAQQGGCRGRQRCSAMLPAPPRPMPR